jgi:hypothetical protein
MEENNMFHSQSVYTLAIQPYARAAMQRDIHLIRKLLAEIRRNNETVMGNPDIPGYAQEVIGHHLGQLHRAGFLEVADASGTKLVIKDLSFSGHDLAGVLLNEGVWRELTAKLTPDELNSVPLDVLEQTGKDLIRKWTNSKLGL